MANEITGASPTESAAAPSAAASTVTAPAPATTASTPNTGPAEPTSTAPATALPEGWEWNGNVDEVEPAFRKRALGMQRYFTKRTQELSDSQKKAEEYDRVKSDPAFQQYINSRNGNQVQSVAAPGTIPAPQFNPTQVVNPDEWRQLGLDPAVGQAVNKLIETRLVQAEQQVGGLLTQLTSKQAQIEQRQVQMNKTQEIQDFAELHPDFWELYDEGILEPIVREVVDTRKGNLLDAYTKAKSIKDSFFKKAIQKSQERVTQKKTAISATPTPATESDTVWVDNPADSLRVAFENALQNKRVNVRTRK